MAVKTDSECVTLILQKLFVLESGETADADDVTLATTSFDSRIEWLRDEGVCYWNDDEIPVAAFDALAEYMTYYCAVLPFEERVPYKGASDMGLRDLRKLSAKAAEGPPVRADYF